ncbi:MAG: cell division protein ZapA [Syntrophomonadaceae bacterium]|nr:cell division protein ZapA [Syntrophomonadaceae bacterium]
MKTAAKSPEEPSRVVVTIYGEEYVVKGSAEPEHIKRIAKQVDQKMVQIARRNPSLSPGKVAVLTALNLADELVHLQEDYDHLVKLLDEDSTGAEY